MALDSTEFEQTPETVERNRQIKGYGKKHPRSRAALTAYEEKLERDEESKHDDIYEEEGQYG